MRRTAMLSRNGPTVSRPPTSIIVRCLRRTSMRCSLRRRTIGTFGWQSKLWLGSAPDQAFSEEKFNHWRWFWDFGGGAMTDLFTHWIDVVHWAMKSDQPRGAQVLADKYVFEQWDCPDTIQAAFRYPGFDVGYEGMMNSSIVGGGLECRGTEATLKINRSGFEVYREHIDEGEGKNPVLTDRSFRAGTISHMENFFACIKSPKEPNAPVEPRAPAAPAAPLPNLPS